MTFFEICKLNKKDLKVALERELINNGYTVTNEDGFLYAPGEIPVLLIAHMDTVHKEEVKSICVSDDGVVMSPQGIGGDDRCGIFMILETIKTHRVHVLFCEDEEIGLIGAGKFAKSDIKPDVNYIIEYDRKGKDDAVFYSCDNPEFTKFITDTDIGFIEAHGSASDISKVAPAINAAAVNLSCGYYNQHTLHEYVVISEMMNNIERGKRIIDKPCEHFDYIEKTYSYTKYNYSNYKDTDWYKKYYGSGYSSYGGYGNYYSDIYDDDDDDYGLSSDQLTITSSKTEDKYDYSDEMYDSIYSEVIDDIDSYSVKLFDKYYETETDIKSLIPLESVIVDSYEGLYIVTDVGTEMSCDEYYDLKNSIDIYIDVNCRLYTVTRDNDYGINIAVQSDDYLYTKTGQIQYYNQDVQEYSVMTPLEYKVFVEYVESWLELDIDEYVEDNMAEMEVIKG